MTTGGGAGGRRELDDGIERDLDLSIDSLTYEISTRLMLPGGSGAGVAVNGDDRACPDAA